MVGEYLGEHGLVAQQRVELILRNLGERLVGGREHGKRSGSLERVDQAGLLDGGDEGLEAAGRHGGIDNVGSLDREGSDGQGGGDEGLFHG